MRMSAFAYSISLSNNWFAGKASAPFFGWRGGYAGLSLCPTEFSLNCELVTDFGVSSRSGQEDETRYSHHGAVGHCGYHPGLCSVRRRGFLEEQELTKEFAPVVPHDLRECVWISSVTACHSLRHSLGQMRGAAEDLEVYLKMSPDASDADEIRQTALSIRRTLARMN